VPNARRLSNSPGPTGDTPAVRTPDPAPAPPVELTFVVPVHNEEENLEDLHAAISAVATEMGRPVEMVYVDDGSTDRSHAILLDLRQRDPRIKIVKFRANFGQTPALAAGFEEARGNVVITLDADLQNDPADVPKLLAELERGYDVVSGWRRDRKEPYLSRRLPSLIANRCIAWLTGLSIHDSGCTLKAYRTRVVKKLPLYADAHRFLPAIASIRGARVGEIPVHHRPRARGYSKYGIGRTSRVLFDLLKVRVLVRFSSRPLHWFGLGALPAFFLGTVALIANLFAVLQFGSAHHVVRQMTGESFGELNVVYMSTALLFLGLGIHFVLMGLLGELAVKASRDQRAKILDSILAEVHE